MQVNYYFLKGCTKIFRILKSENLQTFKNGILKKYSPKLKNLFAILWIISLTTLGLMVIYGDGRTNSNKYPMNLTSRILYDSLSRILWSLAMSFIIYACVTSYGGFVNEFFSWKVWQPLSKLSFCAYLIQYTIFEINKYTPTHPLHLQWTNFVR